MGDAAGDADPAQLIAAAYGRLTAVRTARILYRREADLADPQFRRNGLMARFATKVIDATRHAEAEGVLDAAIPAIAYDYGGFACTEHSGESWTGGSGRPITGRLRNKDRRAGPAWVLAAGARITAANLEGAEIEGAAAEGGDEIRGVACTRLRANVDLRALVAEPWGRWSTVTKSASDSLVAHLQVWLDDQHLRRVSLTHGSAFTYTVELWDFGLDLTGFEWSRLATFRTAADEPGARPPHVL